MTAIRAFSPKIRAFFPNFRKSARETSLLPPSGYAPGYYVQPIKVHYLLFLVAP